MHHKFLIAKINTLIPGISESSRLSLVFLDLGLWAPDHPAHPSPGGPHSSSPSRHLGENISAMLPLTPASHKLQG